MKKGETSSYSALIGLIIGTLMLVSLLYVVYYIYKPEGSEYFDKLTNFLKNLEIKGVDSDGEVTFYAGEYEALIGFSKNEENIKKPLWGLFENSCYGIKFGNYFPSVFGVEYAIERPDNCPSDKSCLCICKLSKSITTTNIGSIVVPSGFFYIHPKACKGSEIKCEIFETLNLIGGKGCPYGVFIPGTKNIDKQPEKRGIGMVYYSKKGNTVSIDDEETKQEEELKKILEEEKQKDEEKGSLAYLEQISKKIESCINQNESQCICDQIVLKEIPENYNIKIEYGNIEKDSSKYVNGILFSLKNPDNNLLEKTGFSLDSDKIGLVCYKLSNKEIKMLQGDKCSAITISSKGAGLTGDCCELREWTGEDTVIYVIKESDGKTYLTTRKTEMNICKNADKE